MELMLAFSLTDQDSEEAADLLAHRVAAEQGIKNCWRDGWQVRKAKRFFRIKNARSYYHFEVWGDGVDLVELERRLNAVPQDKLAALEQRLLEERYAK